ncbi:hypothetical protein F183_A47600 [Bryobacterales bacterium F-183]|nr:hypothetical protein F183_A47600 [Bryobacterales bacterium F-183]
MKTLISALLVFVSGMHAAEVAGAAGFLKQNCVGCHGAKAPQGGLDLTQIAAQGAKADNLATWVKVYDRVASGEMPPKGMPRPAGAPAFLKSLETALVTEETARRGSAGRAGLRRLNAYEYENAIRDLLAVPWIRVKDQLPQDGIAYRFNKTGGALDVSHVQIARYMSTAQTAMREAMSAKFVQAPTATTRVYARQEPTMTRNMWPREGNTRTDRMSFPVLDSHAQPDVRAGRSPISNPETREREAMGRVSSIFSDAGGFSWGSYRIPAPGRYKIRVKGYSIWVSGGGIDHWNFTGFGPEKTAYLYTPRMERPNTDEVWPGRRNEPVAVYAQSSGQSRPLGEFDFTPEPGVYEIEAVLAPNEVLQTDSMRLFRTRVNGTELEYVNPLATKDGMPGVAFQWIEVTGPLADESNGAGYRALFGDLPLRKVAAGEGVAIKVPAPVETGDAVPIFRRGPRLMDVPVEVETSRPREDAERLLRAFLARAYRGPVEESDVQLFLKLFDQQFQQGRGFAKSMIAAYTAVLSSPGFLYVRETPGKLSGHELATRLSLFLWNSPPDAELRGLAASGKLQTPAVLRAQTERLLNDPKMSRFVEAFTDYWLDLRKIDDTSPSTTLYNDYELDDPLKLAAMEETRLFVGDLFKRNLPARSIVQADFTYLNERLATHYGIAGVTGAKMRRVALPADSVRGGLLTQASVLKVTANGTTTSPVLRGVWIMERILGMQAAPPPGVPAVEPDIRGAVTIRQQLDKHRADASCASCHRKIDPPGFALESFDVMGGWRTRYRAAADTAKPEPGVGFSGQKFAFHYALPVDATGTLPDGSSFRDVREFKRVLLAREEDTVARNLARQLLVYATGAPPGFADRKRVDEILAGAKASGYGVRNMVHGIVQSSLFQAK